MTDLFLENRRRGCEQKLEAIEKKLIKWSTKKTIVKFIFMKHIEHLEQQFEDYAKLYKQLDARYNKKMHRVVLRQDAFSELRHDVIDFNRARKAIKEAN